MRSTLIAGAWLALAVAAAGLALRLFTATFHYTDDATAGVLLKATPAWATHVTDPDLRAEQPLVIDENGFRGEDAYVWLTTTGWWSLLLVAVGLRACAHRRARPPRA